jgi:putative tricarboxylic transport membrane protein
MIGTRILDVFMYALEPTNLLYCAIGCVMGTVVGVLPGLGPAATCAMLLSVTTHLPPEGSIIMLAGIYYGAQYGGSTTSILVNVPGEASSVVTCLDGFPMAKQGRAGQALAIAAIGSFIAGTFGVAVMMFAATSFANFGLKFGPPEYVWLMVFGLTGVVSFAGESILKGLICVAFGALLAALGIDPVTGLQRLTFGSSSLLGGLEVVSLFMGLFGVSEMIDSLDEERQAVFMGKLGKMIPRGKELIRGLAACIRGTLIGFIPGLLPGIVPALTSFWAYDLEKRISKTPEKFGHGMIEGVAGPEAANNATAQAGFIPLMCFGIPTSATLAIVLAALVLHGLQPGPLLFERHAHLVWAVIGSMYIGNVMLLILNLPLVGLWARLSLVPYKILGPLVLGLCFIGSYSGRNAMFDVLICILSGILGFVMKKRGWPSIALVLGFLLGDPLEQSLRQSLAISGGNFGVLVQSSIAKGLAIMTVILLIIGIYAEIKRKRRNALAESLAAERKADEANG